MVCMEKSRCRAVVVKKDNIIMRLMELEFRRQYFANATKALQMEKKKKIYHRDHWFVHSPIIDYASNDLNKTMAVTAIAK